MHSTSPGLRHSLSPLGLSVAQRHAQMVEHIVESAYSNVGGTAEQMRHVQSVIESAIAVARYVRGEVKGKMAERKQCTEASTSTIANVLSSRIE